MENGEKFVEKWSVNGDDLFENGIYEIATDMIHKFSRVGEIGCGTGHSTLALLLGNHKVFAVDIFPECITESENRIQDIGYEETTAITWSDEDATLMRANLFDPLFVNSIVNFDFDIILMWNPGQMDRVKLVDQCAIIANCKGVSLQVIERGVSYEEGLELLMEIASDNRMCLREYKIIPVEWNHQEGIRMEGTDNKTIYMAIGLFEPYSS